MPLPSPEILNRLKKIHTIDTFDGSVMGRELYKQKNPDRILHRIIATVALLGSGVSLYNADVDHNQEYQAADSVTIQYKGDALDEANNDNAIAFLAGTASINALELTNDISLAVQPIIDGRLWSVNYNDADLNSLEIAKTMIAEADEQNVTELTLVLYSAGGNIGMEVQEHIQELSNISLKAIFFLSVPYDTSTLQRASQEQINLIETIGQIPDIEDSTLAGALFDTALRSYKYSYGSPAENTVDLWNTFWDSFDRVSNHEAASSQLIFNQMLAVKTSDLATRISNIGSSSNKKTKPTLIYLVNEHDPIVDNEAAADLIASDANKAGLPFFRYVIKGAVHGNTSAGQDQYIKVLADNREEFQASIETQELIAALNSIPSKQDPIPFKG